MIIFSKQTKIIKIIRKEEPIILITTIIFNIINHVNKFFEIVIFFLM